jgi:hypothetical protein
MVKTRQYRYISGSGTAKRDIGLTKRYNAMSNDTRMETMKYLSIADQNVCRTLSHKMNQNVTLSRNVHKSRMKPINAQCIDPKKHIWELTIKKFVTPAEQMKKTQEMIRDAGAMKDILRDFGKMASGKTFKRNPIFDEIDEKVKKMIILNNRKTTDPPTENMKKWSTVYFEQDPIPDRGRTSFNGFIQRTTIQARKWNIKHLHLRFHSWYHGNITKRMIQRCKTHLFESLTIHIENEYSITPTKFDIEDLGIPVRIVIHNLSCSFGYTENRYREAFNVPHAELVIKKCD